MLYSVIYVLSIVLILLINLIIFVATRGNADNFQTKLRKYFYIFNATIILWTLSQYAYSWPNEVGLNSIIFKTAAVAIIWMGVSFWLFSLSFIEGNISKTQSIISVITGLLLTTLSLFTEIAKYTLTNNVITTQYNLTTYSLITIIPIIFICLGIYSLEKFAKKTLDKSKKKQAKIISRGIITVTIIAFTGNYIFSIAGLDNRFSGLITLLISLTPSIYVLFIGFTVFSLKLFNFRQFFIRSLVYVVSLGIVVTVYATLISLLSRLTTNINNLGHWADVFNILVAILIALTFQPIKKRFDKLTNKIFYRDAYEIQDLVSEFNRALISTIDLEPLLLKVSDIIEKYIKSEYNEFAIRTSDTDIIRVIGKESAKATKETVEQLRAYSKNYTKKVIVTDELGEKDTDFKFMMDKTQIGMLARITSDKKVEGIGYLILGFKKNGNPYTSQDKQAIDIITNGMVVAIQNALQFEEIQLFNITLQQKVDDAIKELKKTNDKLRALDETKDEFISMASHQLRTPLTSVKGYVSMVLEGDAGELKPMQKKLLSQAFFSSQRMVYLIADLLNVSRLKTGKFVIENQPTDLTKVISGEMEQLKETAKAKNLELIYDKPKNFPELMLDETKIRQVIMNFIDNAVYYTPSGGKISINIVDKPDSVDFTVVDSGLGVPKTEQHHLFAKFYRAKNAQKARPDGTGLGLFMAKKVVIAQGGSIIFSSEEGKGSTFGFSFAKNKLDPLPEKH